MGSYSTLTVGGCELFSVKNDIDPLLMSLFRPGDKHVQAVQAAEVQGVHDWAGVGNPNESVTILQYRSTVEQLRDRLDLMGFTERFARSSFERGLARSIKETDTSLADQGSEALHEYYRHKLAVLSRFTFDDWLRGFKEIMGEKLLQRPDLFNLEPPWPDYPVGFMLHYHASDEQFGFPGYDSRTVLRAMCEALEPTSPVVMDLTDLVLGGWYDAGDDLIAEADYLVSADFQTTQRVIVLTEGGSDKRAIEAALALLYPHLAEYFAFMDFDDLSVPGGAGTLVSFVKAFSAAGVINRVWVL